MIFEQFVEFLKVLGPVLVGFIPSFWIIRELNRNCKEIESLRTDNKEFFKLYQTHDREIVELKAKSTGAGKKG